MEDSTDESSTEPQIEKLKNGQKRPNTNSDKEMLPGFMKYYFYSKPRTKFYRTMFNFNNNNNKSKILLSLVLIFLLSLCYNLQECNGAEFITSSIRIPIILDRTDEPYFIRNDIIIEDSGELTIRPGVRLLFSPTVGLTVHGRLIAEVNKFLF